MLGRVNVERSECSRPDDRDCIHNGIRSSVGFVKLSRMVFGVLEEWMEGQLRAQAASCEAGDENETMTWRATLASVLSDQGRHADALAMRQSVLELRRRTLPVDHPDIGEGRVLSAVAACAFADFDAALVAMTRRYGHEQNLY
jgi:hypothetical protein